MESNETIKQEFGFVRKPGMINDTERITNASIDRILSQAAMGLSGLTEKITVSAAYTIIKTSQKVGSIQFNVSDENGKSFAFVRYGKGDAGWMLEYMMSGDSRIHYLFASIAEVFRNDTFADMCCRFGEVFESYELNTRR